MPLHNSSTITNISIPMLLDWWQQRKRLANALGNLRATLPKEDETYLQNYYRLMEVYSVVKSGGVKAQTEAVQAFAKRESGLLNQRLAEIEAAELAESEKRRSRARIKQEMNELRCANDWRLKALTNIEPEEEAVVKQYLPDIEKTLMQAQCA
jgi:hypothetical protein